MNAKTTALMLAAAVAGAVLGIAGWTYTNDPGNGIAHATAAAANAERKVLYWHDPMVPGHRFDKPGKSPFMDMDLVPVYADEAPAEDTAIVTVRPEVVGTLGVRTARAERSSAPRRLETDGYVFRDERGFGVLVDIFDRDAGWVRRGLAAEIRIQELGDRILKGTVSWVSPDVEFGTRSLKARIRLSSPAAGLRANTYAQVAVLGPRPAQARLLVPREALIRTGTRTSVVLALEAGRFKPVDVVVGPEIGEHVEIVDGLADGDRVVTSGQFLLDSEASIRAGFARMESEGPPAAAVGEAAQTDHSGHAGR